MSKSHFKEINFKTTKELFKFLDPLHGELIGREYIFRGQANSEWTLTSTLERNLIESRSNDLNIQQNHFYYEEFQIIEQFIRDCEEIGLELPKFSDSIFNKNNHDNNVDRYLHYMAIGQHYGLPTRLLDWSKNRWVALYFALDLENHLKYSRMGNLTLWCYARMNYNIVHNFGEDFTIDSYRYELKEYNPGFHGNTNAIAQKGIFTYIFNYAYDKDGLLGDFNPQLSKIPIKHLDLEYIAKNANFTFSKNITFLYKLNIPRKFLKEIKNKLFDNYISHKELFPSYAGVCKNIIIEQNEKNRRSKLSAYKNYKKQGNILQK